MLTEVTPVELVRPMGSGRTRPLLLVCEKPSGEPVEVVTKFSANCDEGVSNLAREVIACCLAADLGLPVPTPFLVAISAEWIETLAAPDVEARVRASSRIAFGSTLVTGQYSVWTPGSRVASAMLPTAASILIFDAIIQNPDRRASNPNCLVKGDELRIIDHEMAFTHGLVLGWKQPWALGGLNSFLNPGFHIFRQPLRKKEIDFGPIRTAWLALPDERIEEYRAAIPPAWTDAHGTVELALTLIRQARDNFDGCLAEVRRILG
jgi:hypothetical protein